MKEIWSDFLDFLEHYDSQKLMEAVRSLDWWELAKNPYLWGALVALVAFTVWKKQLEWLILAVSFFLFLALAQHSLPAPGKDISLTSLLEFMGGSIILLGLNVYFLIIREK